MTQRNTYQFIISERIKAAGEHLKSKDYLAAFNQYQATYVEAREGDNSLKLFSYVGMLHCQFLSKMLAADIIIERATGLAKTLTFVISTVSANTAEKQKFEKLLYVINDILAKLNTDNKKSSYSTQLICEAIALSKADDFSTYAGMMELDASVLAYEADYLNMLYHKLTAVNPNSVLIPQLLEEIGSLCKHYAYKSTDIEQKIHFLRQAREMFSRFGIEKQRMCHSDHYKVVILLLPVLKEIYDVTVLQKNDVDSVIAYGDCCQILASAAFNKMFKNADLAERNEIQEYLDWFSIVKSRRDALDKLLMPPPTEPSKKRKHRPVSMFAEPREDMMMLSFDAESQGGIVSSQTGMTPQARLV